MSLLNLTFVSCTLTGTTANLGSAMSGYNTFALAGAVDGTTYTYCLQDVDSATNQVINSEMGVGVYHSDDTFTLTTVRSSTNGGNHIAITKQAYIRITASAEDFAAYEPIDATIVRTGQANWIDLTDGGATTLHSHAGGGVTDHADLTSLAYADSGHTGFQPAGSYGDISGTGIIGRVAEFATTKTLQAANLIAPANLLTLVAGGAYSLTIPATGTAALLGTENLFVVEQTIGGASPVLKMVGTGSTIPYFVGSLKSGTTYYGIQGVNRHPITGVYADTAKYGTSIDQVVKTTDAFIAFGTSQAANGSPVEHMRLTKLGRLAIGLESPIDKLHVLDKTTTANAIKDIACFEAIVSTAATGGAAGFGPGFSLWAETATDGTSKQQGRLWSKWIVPTNGSETAAVGLDAYTNSTGQEFISGQGDAGGVKLAFYAGTRVARGAALTAQLTTITYTAPGTPDYALQDVTNIVPYGFADAEELRTFISVVKNLQDRCAQLEARLGSATGVNLFV